MRKMKDSGVEWIGEIPERWRIASINKLFNIKAGGDLNKEHFSEIRTDEYKFPIFTNAIKSDEIYGYTDQPYYKANTITVTGRGDIGYAIYRDCEYDAIIRLLVLTPNFDYCCKYYEYFINGVLVFTENSSAVGQLSAQQFAFHKVCIPTETEQLRLINYLDHKCAEIDSIIKAKETTNEKLKEYRQSVIYEAVTKSIDKTAKMKDSGIEWIGEIPVGWETKKLKYIGESIIGITYTPDNISDEGTLVLRSSNIQSGKLSFEDNVYVSKVISKKMLVKKDDILICSRNGSQQLIGKCALIDEDTQGSTFGAFMTLFRSKSNRYIYYIMNSHIFNFHIGTFLTTTVNQLTINNLNNIVIPIPKDEKDQQQIVDYLDRKCTEIDSVIDANTKIIEKLKEYRQSVIYEAVTGKVEV